MNSFYLSMVLRLIGFLATSDLFAVERAALARRINPAVLDIVERLVTKVDKLDTLSGAEKKESVVGQVPAYLAASNSQVNQVIEWAVAKLRAAKGGIAQPTTF